MEIFGIHRRTRRSVGNCLPETYLSNSSETVFEPLDMKETKFFVDEKDSHRLIEIYGDDNIDSTAIFRDRTNKLIKIKCGRFYPRRSIKSKTTRRSWLVLDR